MDKLELTHEELISYLRRWSDDETQKEVAHKLIISPQYLNDVLCGRREPGKKLLDGLRLRREIRYVSQE